MGVIKLTQKEFIEKLVNDNDSNINQLSTKLGKMPQNLMRTLNNGTLKMTDLIAIMALYNEPLVVKMSDEVEYLIV